MFYTFLNCFIKYQSDDNPLGSKHIAAMKLLTLYLC
jgi:hypothetical protein